MLPFYHYYILLAQKHAYFIIFSENIILGSCCHDDTFLLIDSWKIFIFRRMRVRIHIILCMGMYVCVSAFCKEK